MSVCLMSDRRPKGSIPTEVHRVGVQEYERTGSFPPATVISELTGIDRVAVTRALKGLCEEGILAQPHGGRAPYVPLYRPDGTRVRPVLVAVEGGDEELPIALAPRSAVDLLREALERLENGEG